ncbi:BTB/POZ domain-containing protein 6-B-like [Paramacrobiotus metropolitanus]|uniref:BTB/POZ domain-containing protein 6-B-like n=1 Tax=Paramacrobiotus metropolitanus TaxID=2943436 RepID=UPI002445F9D0|nr:BTB/POZ domain-containing protein 6-B-like [Paramacrobiotus metropolitanus]
MASTNPASSKVSQKHGPVSTLASSMKQMLTSGELSDLKFAVGCQLGPVQIFQTHKYVMSMRGSVFRTMFYGSLPESCEAPIEIPHFIPNLLSVWVFIFMYTDQAENLSADNVFHTMNCADKYDFAPLVHACLEMIYSQLTVNNCLSALEQVRL